MSNILNSKQNNKRKRVYILIPFKILLKSVSSLVSKSSKNKLIKDLILFYKQLP